MAEFIRKFLRRVLASPSRPSSFAAAMDEMAMEPLESARVSCVPALTPIPGADEIFLVVTLTGETAADFVCENVWGHATTLAYQMAPGTLVAVTIKTGRAETRRQVFFRAPGLHDRRTGDEARFCPGIRALGWRTYRESLPAEFPGLIVV